MRIVIDMQGVQTGSRFRGIGRYSLSLTKAIVRNKGEHNIILVFNGLFPDLIESICHEFNGLLPEDNIHIVNLFGPTKEIDVTNQDFCRVAEKMREAFLADLRPDVVLITSLFEGLSDDAVVSIGCLYDTIPTAVILYDLIPLISPDIHFKTSKIHQEWYLRKISSLKKSQMLLAISENSRQEAISALDFAPEMVFNISGASDEFFSISSLKKIDFMILLQKYGISKRFIMYTGGADERKNLHRLIAAYSQLPLDIKNKYQLVFAGKMPESDTKEYLQVAINSGLKQGDLILTGYIDDTELHDLYNKCELFVFPSTYEGLGLPPLEAMACGAPVIGSNTSSLPEVIGLEEAMFDPYSIKDICDKINKALTQKSFRKKLIDHSRNHIKKFSWDESAKRVLNALKYFDSEVKSCTSLLVNVEKTSTYNHRKINILAIKLDHFGDFILAIPAFMKLRARYPYANIDIIIGSWNEPIAKKINVFDKILIYDFFNKKSAILPSVSENNLTKILNSLYVYDIVIDFRRQPDTRFILTRINSPIKVGYQTFNQEIDKQIQVLIPGYPDEPYKITEFNNKSMSYQLIDIVDSLPNNTNDYIQYPCLSENKIFDYGTVAIFPKAGNEVKEWPIIKYLELIENLISNPLINLINIYFSDQYEAIDYKFLQNPKVKIHIGLEFIELVESVSKNQICIANNSGGVHLASYLNVTTLGIYSGHELPSEWAPQYYNSFVIHRAAGCAPCHADKQSSCMNDLFCIKDISVGDVYTTVLKLMGKNTENREEKSKKNQYYTYQLSSYKNTDSIVNDLITSISNDLHYCDNSDIINISLAISKNHKNYSVFPDLKSIKPNILYDHKCNIIEWRGFSGIEPYYRWSDGDNAEIIFDYQNRSSKKGEVLLLFETFGEQNIIFYFNGIYLYKEKMNGLNIEKRISFNNILEGKNSLYFCLPDAKMPGNGDTRKLAIAIKKIMIMTKL